MSTISGKYLQATVGAMPTVIAGTHEWSGRESGDRLEGTTGANNGRGRKYCGVIDGQFRIRFYFDVNSGLAAFIRTGTVLTNLKLYADEAATNPIYALTSATVFDFNMVGRVRDTFIVDADIESNGDVITFNDGN